VFAVVTVREKRKYMWGTSPFHGTLTIIYQLQMTVLDNWFWYLDSMPFPPSPDTPRHPQVDVTFRQEFENSFYSGTLFFMERNTPFPRVMLQCMSSYITIVFGKQNTGYFSFYIALHGCSCNIIRIFESWNVSEFYLRILLMPFK
jgi:hypothetical protein